MAAAMLLASKRSAKCLFVAFCSSHILLWERVLTWFKASFNQLFIDMFVYRRMYCKKLTFRDLMFVRETPILVCFS